MVVENRRINTQMKRNDYVEEIFELYSSSVGEFNICEFEERFIKSLIENCVNIFSETEIFDILKLLRKKELINESILKFSVVQKVNRSSNIQIRETVKCEIEEFTYNSSIKHINDCGDIMFSYETECFTLPSLEDKLVIGDNFANIIYKDNGKSIEHDIIKSNKSKIDFQINNIIILHKKENSTGNTKEYLNIIIVPKFESKITNKYAC